MVCYNIKKNVKSPVHWIKMSTGTGTNYYFHMLGCRRFCLATISAYRHSLQLWKICHQIGDIRFIFLSRNIEWPEKHGSTLLIFQSFLHSLLTFEINIIDFSLNIRREISGRGNERLSSTFPRFPFDMNNEINVSKFLIVFGVDRRSTHVGDCRISVPLAGEPLTQRLSNGASVCR